MNQCNIQVLLPKSKYVFFIVISGLGFEIQVFPILPFPCCYIIESLSSCKAFWSLFHDDDGLMHIFGKLYLDL